MKRLKHKQSLIIFTFILLFSLNSVIISIIAQGEDVLSLGISKNFGTDIGNKIEGNFTISGSGPDSILNLRLLFNGTRVAFEPGNQLTFQFETKDYPLGLMNITLIGEDCEGIIYKKVIFREFVSPKVGSWLVILAFVITFISVSVMLIIVSYRKKKKNEKESITEKKKRIKIDIDKKFL